MSDNSNNNLQVGTVLDDKWVILEFIAKGGMGEVYRAHQMNLKRDVAIKIISKEWLESIEDDKEEVEVGLQRFRNEVLAMAQVRHPNILQIYDYGSFSVEKGHKKVPIEYIAMEFIPGGTLRSTMSEDGFYPEEDLTGEWLLSYFLPVLDGVQALHASEIIHRDLKPGNVLMDGKIPKIADLGLARSYQWRPVTQSIDVKGTPAYMSPEHFYDLRRTDHRADIYSLGKILFEAIVGRMTSKVIPFKRASLSNPESPFFKNLDRVIQDATAEDRNERLDSVEEFRNAILAAISTVERENAPAVSTHAGPFSTLFHPKWIWTGIIATTLSILLMTLWHLFGEQGKSNTHPNRPPATDYQIAQPKPPVQSNTVLPVSGPHPLTLTGKDGATLHLIPEGEVTLPESFGPEAGKSVQVDSFYMDETEVTNHQYVGFLNQVISRISVKGVLVEGDGNVWFYLGEVRKRYEPIVFRDGRFFLKDPVLSSHPVVRVTPYGAVSYAHFYGRRIPTGVEWLHVIRAKGATQTPSNVISGDRGLTDMEEGWVEREREQMNMENMHKQMVQRSKPPAQAPSKALSPVAVLKPNAYGIRGLEGNISEWALGLQTGFSQRKEETQYMILPESVSRHPWEAFEEVGFRTVMSIPTQRG